MVIIGAEKAVLTQCRERVQRESAESRHREGLTNPVLLSQKSAVKSLESARCLVDLLLFFL